MRTDFGVDQADGLRRILVRARHGEAEPSGAGVPATHLLPQSAGYAGNVPEVRNQARVITLVAGKSGVGRTSVAINLAAALARSGKNVMVLDENNATNNVLDSLGLYARHDLLDVAQGKCMFGDAVLNAGGFDVLSAARSLFAMAASGPYEERASEGAAIAGAGPDQAGQQRLVCALAEAGSGVDVILVDAAMPALMEPLAIRSGHQPKSHRPGARKTIANMSRVEAQARSAAAQMPGGIPFAGARSDSCAVSSGLARGDALLVVVDATTSGITGSYALIKRMALGYARLQFGIVVNKVADEQAARTVFENMAKLACRNLAARLDYLGCIPHDDSVKRAAQMGKPVVEAFPSAASSQSYTGLAHGLLLMPLRQDEAEGGVRTAMRGPVKQAAQPRQRLCREIAHVVN